MKRQIRQSVFETNSSSTHAVAILTEQEFQDYRQGKLLITRNGTLYTREEYEKKLEDEKQRTIQRCTRIWNNQPSDEKWPWERFRTLEEYIDYATEDLYLYEFENMEIEYAERTVGDEKVHALSVYGYES